MCRIQSDESAALSEALQRYWAPLLAYAHSMLDGVDAAEDAVQETFISLWERRRDWQRSDSLRALLYTILRNRTLNEQRRRRVRLRWLEREGSAKARSNPTPLDLLEAGELSVAIWSAIEGLPARRREVFILARYHALSRHEIAAVMGIAPQTVANQLSAALADLKGSLETFLEDLPKASAKSRGSEGSPPAIRAI